MRRLPLFLGSTVSIVLLAASLTSPTLAANRPSTPRQAAAPAPAAAAAAVDVRNRVTPDTDTHVVLPSFTTRTEWETHRDDVRRRILRAAGLDPMPVRTPLNPSRTRRLERDGYRVETVVLETWPGFFLAGNLYSPTTPGPHPAVVSPHGHWAYGRFENSAVASVPARAQQLARQGHVVFIYDMVGYGDTTQVPHAFGAEPTQQLWSFGPLGLQLWNSLRVVDFLASLPDVDPARIGATGASGGATQVFLLAAIDSRIAYAAPVNMVSAYMQGGSPCENAPGLRLGISNLDIIAAMAPRPMLLVSATGDWTSHAPQEEVPAIRRIYQLYGAPERLVDQQFDAPHNYHQGSREAVYRFLNAQAFGRTDAVEERGVRIEPLADVQAWHAHPRPASAQDLDGLFASWRDAAQRQTDASADAGDSRRRLVGATEAVWPSQVERGSDGVITRDGTGERVATWYRAGRGVPLVAVHPGGLAAGRALPAVAAAVAADRPVLVVEPFQTGEAVTARARDHRHFLTFNVTDDQARIQDVATALAWVSTKGAAGGRPAGAPIDVIAEGDARYWAALAILVAPPGTALPVDSLRQLPDDDATLARAAFVPGLQRAGGMPAVVRLLEERP